MPQFTPEQKDDVAEAIDRQLFRIARVFRKFFGEDMTPDELRRAHTRIQQGVDQAVSERQAPPQMKVALPPSKPPALGPADLAEGGFINDSSGMATALERKRLGIGGP